jgi:hypothetical protein
MDSKLQMLGELDLDEVEELVKVKIFIIYK